MTPPGEIDSAARAQLLRIAVYFGPPCFFIVSLAWFSLWYRGVISVPVLVLLLILNVPLTIGGVRMIHHLTSHASAGVVRALFSAGDIAPPPSYPRQEMLVARGQYAEAADYFRDHIRVHPEDLEARLRLAALLERHLKDDAAAERLYVEVRRSNPTPREEVTAANGLIDLHRRTGRREQLKVELARFADRYRGTPPGEAAARELRGLKAEDAPAPPPSP